MPSISISRPEKTLKESRKDSERIARAVEVLHGKWTIDILCELRQGPVRLGQLKRLIPTASKKALTSSLRWLEVSGLVVRKDLTQSILHIEYELDAHMKESIGALLDYLASWSSSLLEPGIGNKNQQFGSDGRTVTEVRSN